jgi:hypothetical protein
MSIRIEIKNLGPIPSFKNRKRVAGKRIVTDPEVQHWMELCTQSIMLQLNSEYLRQVKGKMRITKPLPVWIAENMPLDDSISWIPNLTITTTVVPEGQEGATITYTKI